MVITLDNTYLFKNKDGFILCARDCDIPKYALFFASDNNTICVNMAEHNIREGFPFYYLILATTFAAGSIPTQDEFDILLQTKIIQRELLEDSFKEWQKTGTGSFTIPGL